ncbi:MULTISPECIES: FadR/GntR family transcriptional regulator [Arsenicicoccus]|uniref:FadR/GntR family transcriptional regulator n=1 Tax=Arsenicicoccus TaxID=267408 RepID=UPI00257DDF95|nr:MULTISPECIES: FCD domain-containing protein [Arsenicicoccus]
MSPTPDQVRDPAQTATRPARMSAQDLVPEVVLRPVREGQAYEATLEQLATAVRLGVLTTGSQLPPERELATRLGVSRVTLREAIATLRDLGMVETRRGRAGGSFVTYDWAAREAETGDAAATTEAELEDVLGFRRVVEPGTAYLAASRALPATDRGWLKECLRDVSDASRRDAAEHRQADSRLHLAIAGLSGSPSLVEAVSRSQSALHQLLAAIPVLPRNIEHSNADHEAVVDAILSGEPEDARELAEEHCDKTAALLRGLLAHPTTHPGGTP